MMTSIGFGTWSHSLWGHYRCEQMRVLVQMHETAAVFSALWVQRNGTIYSNLKSVSKLIVVTVYRILICSAALRIDKVSLSQCVLFWLIS
jgi:hypothetical protein